MWRCFLKWLQEPIPFPGMTYDIELPQSEYNQRKTNESIVPRNQ
jgi:hypothetical protein